MPGVRIFFRIMAVIPVVYFGFATPGFITET